jgi:hypothetical protein
MIACSGCGRSNITKTSFFLTLSHKIFFFHFDTSSRNVLNNKMIDD